MTFQFSIWDKIKDLENLSAAAISNLVSLLVHLLRTKSLSLSVLKVGVFFFSEYFCVFLAFAKSMENVFTLLPVWYFHFSRSEAKTKLVLKLLN